MTKPKRQSCMAGRLFIISAPSGCGKTTLCQRILEDKLGLIGSVSITTRPPRPDERDGADYHFVSEKRFREMIRAGRFLEYEENFGYLYGTPAKFVSDNVKKGKSVLLSIDVKGAMKVRKAYERESVLIFILPPSLSALKRRLVRRSSDDPYSIAMRLRNARREISASDRYSHRIVNDRLDRAYRQLKKIVAGEMGSKF